MKSKQKSRENNFPTAQI